MNVKTLHLYLLRQMLLQMYTLLVIVETVGTQFSLIQGRVPLQT